MSIFLLNPFVFATIPAIVREYFSSGYTVTRATTTSNLYSTISSISTVETAGDRFAAFWQATMDNSSNTTGDARARFFETTVIQLSNIEPQDTTDRMSVGGVHAYSGGTNRTYSLTYSAESAGNTIGIAGAEVNILKLDASDKFNYNSATVNATANAASTTITEAGDYLVIGSGMLGAADNAVIFDGTNSYGAVDVSMNQDNTTFSPFWHVRQFTGLTNETLSVRVTVGQIRQSSILALKLDKFENVYYAEDPNQFSTTSNTYVSAFSNTFTIANPSNQHLILACAQLNSNSTTQSANAKLINVTAAVDYNVQHIRENNSATEWYPTVVARIVTFSSASQQIQWQLLSESTNNAGIRNMAIAILDLGTT